MRYSEILAILADPIGWEKTRFSPFQRLRTLEYHIEMQTGVLGYQGARIGRPVACRPKLVNEKIHFLLVFYY
jgi:hypothetical protein